MKLLSFLPGLRDAPVTGDWHATEPWVRFGMRTVVYMCGGLLLGALAFSVSGAVVASGTVSVEGDYKAVQHLEGGIVSKILVHNGDRVKIGQVLVRLDDTQARASANASSAKVAEYALQEARLIAERDRRETFELPASLTLSEGDTEKVFAAQKALFETRRSNYLGQRLVLKQKLAQTDGDIAGGASQLAARIKERDLNERELATVRPLFDKGYVSQQRIGPLEREAARLGGDVENLKASMSKLKAARREIDERLAQADKEYSQQSADELQKVQASLAEQREVKNAAIDKLARTEIRSPASGIVHAMAVHTEGGVIPQGGTLLQIVPEGREYLIEAKIATKDVASVYVGQDATVRFSSFDSHTTPRLTGRVRTVSAAEITDNQGKSYFTTQIEVPPAELMKLESGQHLVPGMPAEVYLATRSRSILSYFIKPLGDMMAGAFRER